MKRAIGLVVFGLLAASAAAQEVVFVVRHAERADQSADSGLSAEGKVRAERLASLLRDSGITRIYTTHLTRSIETGAPVASALHVPATALSGSTDDLVRRLRAAGPTERILVVGHSNTVPDVLSALGVVPRAVLGDTEYDNLFIVIPHARGAPQVVRLRY